MGITPNIPNFGTFREVLFLNWCHVPDVRTMYAPVAAPAAPETTEASTEKTWDVEVQSLANAVTLRLRSAMTSGELRSEIAQHLGIAAKNQRWHVQGERLDMQELYIGAIQSYNQTYKHSYPWPHYDDEHDDDNMMTHYDLNIHNILKLWLKVWHIQCIIGNFHDFLLQHDVIPRVTPWWPIISLSFITNQIPYNLNSSSHIHVHRVCTSLVNGNNWCQGYWNIGRVNRSSFSFLWKIIHILLN